MADHLARIFGTEEDKVNCSFYHKIGACRHGDRCSRTHHRPLFSQTIMVPHLYMPPPVDPVTGMPIENEDEFFEDFLEEIYEEFAKFGDVEQLHVVENLGEHMFGNVYVKFRNEEEAEAALKALSGRFYSGRLLQPEYSPVTDFTEARCRQYDEEHCNRGGYCNFMHLKVVPRHLRRKLREGRGRSDRDNRTGRERRADRGRDERDRRERDSSRRDDRDRDRGDRDRSDRDRRERDRGDRDRESRRRSRSRDRSSREEGSSSGRSASEERRAKIAQWNKERASASGEGGSGSGITITPPVIPGQVQAQAQPQAETQDQAEPQDQDQAQAQPEAPDHEAEMAAAPAAEEENKEAQE